jgi:group I intron endonuclease
MAKSGIYKIKFTDSPKIYIGSAIDLVKRRRNHLSDLRTERHPNIHLQRMFNKYGEKQFMFQVIENCELDILVTREQYFIDQLQPEINILKIAHSSLGYRHTEEAILKIRKVSTEKAKDDEWLAKVSGNWFIKGSTRSDESRSKQSATLKINNHFTGKKHSEASKQKMRAAALRRHATAKGTN